MEQKKTTPKLIYNGVHEGTKFELFLENIVQEIQKSDNIIFFEKLHQFLAA